MLRKGKGSQASVLSKWVNGVIYCCWKCWESQNWKRQIGNLAELEMAVTGGDRGPEVGQAARCTVVEGGGRMGSDTQLGVVCRCLQAVDELLQGEV